MRAPMDPSVERFLRSMQAAGVRRVPAPHASASPPPARPREPAPADEPARQGERAAPAPRAATSSLFGGARAAPPSASGPAPVADPAAELQRVASEVLACRACGLCETRTKAVPGEGNPRARVVFVGEGPGADEDRT